MAFEELAFTRDWTNPEDFPTVVTDETTVRADQQALHNEVRDYINNQLLPTLNVLLSTSASVVEVTLNVSGWNASKQQTVVAAGVSSDETSQLIQVIPAAGSLAAAQECEVRGIAQAENSLTFECGTVPTVDLTFYAVLTEVNV